MGQTAKIAKGREASRQATDWRANILRDLPDGPVQIRGESYDSAWELIKIAAYNRRMHVRDFIARAALAVAVYDSDGEISWEDATDKEPPLADLRLNQIPRRRLRGKGFGPWKIRGMDE